MGADDTTTLVPEMLLRGSLSDGQLDGLRCGGSDFQRQSYARAGSSSSSGNSARGSRGGALESESDVSQERSYHRKGAYPKGAGRAARHPQSYAPTPWKRSLSDSLLEQGRGFTTPPETLLTLDCKSLRQTASLPAVLRAPERESERRRCGSERRLSLSQARLIIPRSVSEYFDCCRYSRSHSEGLLFSSSRLSGVFVGCHDLAGKALSEGLLGGRMMPSGERSAEGQEKPAAPPRPIPVEELKEGTIMEGKIVELRHIGFFVEVGATQTGLLRRRHCQGCPRRLLQQGQVLSNLVVLNVDKKRRRFGLALHGIDGSHLQEEAYDAVLERIAGWAGVAYSKPTADEACAIAVGDFVTLTSDEETLRTSFESIRYNWDSVMLNLLGTTQEVLEVRAEGSIIGLREAVPNSGRPIWYYSRSVFTLQAPVKASTSSSSDRGQQKGKGKGKGRGRAATYEDANGSDERVTHAETPRAGTGGKGKQWQRRDKTSADASFENSFSGGKNKKGKGKGRGKGYNKGGSASNGWSRGSQWW